MVRTRKQVAQTSPSTTKLPTPTPSTSKSPKPANPKLQSNLSIKFDCNEKDPVIDHLKMSSSNQTMNDEVNIETEVLDQIALEGLSGATLGRLFRLLDALFPNLNSTTDYYCQHYIWAMIINRYMRYSDGANVRAFYLDPKKKSSQSKSDIKGPTVSLRSITLPRETTKRVAKADKILYPTSDGQIMGSCASYLDRVDISHDVIEKSTTNGTENSMHLIHKQYGLNNVFFVASQALRSRAIYPNWADPSVDIKLREYCSLELIGKSRTLGIIFPNDKAFGRYRLLLLAKGFITQYQETNCSPIEHHLRRFSHKKQGYVIEQSPIDDDEDKRSRSIFCMNCPKLRADRSILSIVYNVVAESENGISQIDIRKKLSMPKFHVRNHIKNLIALKLICSRVVRDGDNPTRIYKTAKESSKRKKKKRHELAKATGIMKNWDEVDLRAKKIIGRKRSSFSQAEDSLLVLCRITSLLLEPNRKVSWCVHKRFVRDLLHGELTESHDKTSDSCLRRIKYLRKLPNNIKSINELIAELRDDTDIIRLVERKKNIVTDDKLNKLFIQVLNKVRVKTPSLLGINTSWRGSFAGIHHYRHHLVASGYRIYDRFQGLIDDEKAREAIERAVDIKDYQELRDKYEMVDCQSRSSTYDQSKKLSQKGSAKTPRYQSGSLIQFANPIGQSYRINLSEANDMTSIALLASACTLSSFQLDLKLKVPAKVVSVDTKNENFDCLIVQPCNVNFCSDLDLSDHNLVTKLATWKNTDLATLNKLIGSLLSWIIVNPGAERRLLQVEFSHMIPSERLHELLELMEKLDLISIQKLEFEWEKPCLFGHRRQKRTLLTYEASASAYLKYCQLLDYRQ